MFRFIKTIEELIEEERKEGRLIEKKPKVKEADVNKISEKDIEFQKNIKDYNHQADYL